VLLLSGLPAGDLHSMERAAIEKALLEARHNKSKAGLKTGRFLDIAR